MFGLIKEKSWSPRDYININVVPNAPVLIEGLQELETLCPVNPLTGHRTDVITVLRYALTDKNKGLLDKVLAELPTVKQMDVSDDVKLETLVSVLDIQSQTDRDIVAKELLSISSVLLNDGKIDAPLDDSKTIEFSSSDSPDNANV